MKGKQFKVKIEYCEVPDAEERLFRALEILIGVDVSLDKK